MSRCLTFPPPGYVWNGMSGEGLLELIKTLKVQRERVKAERRKKEKKRRKEKKEEREQGEILHNKRHHKRHKRLRGYEDNEERSKNQGKNEYATAGIERSTRSDELEQPIPDSLYASSDNSQSIQRKRNCRPCIKYQNHGSIIQIVFQLQKEKTSEALCSKPDCFTGMIDTAVQEFALPPPREFCHSSQRARVNLDEKSEMTLTESLYRELVVNWIPPPLQIKYLGVGDQAWLFERKPPRRDILETSNTSKDIVLDHGNSAPCLHGHRFLHLPAMIDSGVQKKLGLDPIPVKEQISSACGVPSTDSHELAPPSQKVLHNSFSQEDGIDSNEKFEMAPTSSCSQVIRESVVNRVTSSLQSEHLDIGDKKWLFETKQARSDTRETSTASYDVLHQGNFTPYQRAQYLPQANIYALPYTILN